MGPGLHLRRFSYLQPRWLDFILFCLHAFAYLLYNVEETDIIYVFFFFFCTWAYLRDVRMDGY